MQKIIYIDELYHYGVKGMKRGVRKGTFSRESHQLDYTTSKGSYAGNGTSSDKRFTREWTPVKKKKKILGIARRTGTLKRAEGTVGKARRKVKNAATARRKTQAILSRLK